ncbi:hypothetical protein NQD34_009012 [Periophthalmus magnuspinnatus]|nr:hypothetical protein NQD34_009012 [Periophthalmus magnuspinnatus]
MLQPVFPVFPVFPVLDLKMGHNELEPVLTKRGSDVTALKRTAFEPGAKTDSSVNATTFNVCCPRTSTTSLDTSPLRSSALLCSTPTRGLLADSAVNSPSKSVCHLSCMFHSGLVASE